MRDGKRKTGGKASRPNSSALPDPAAEEADVPSLRQRFASPSGTGRRSSTCGPDKLRGGASGEWDNRCKVLYKTDTDSAVKRNEIVVPLHSASFSKSLHV